MFNVTLQRELRDISTKILNLNFYKQIKLKKLVRIRIYTSTSFVEEFEIQSVFVHNVPANS